MILEIVIAIITEIMLNLSNLYFLEKSIAKKTKNILLINFTFNQLNIIFYTKINIILIILILIDKINYLID